MPADVESMAYVAPRGIPWWIGGEEDRGQGHALEELATAEEMLVRSGLDWEVRQDPVYQNVLLDKDDPFNKQSRAFMAVPNRVFNVRSTDEKVLGLVTPAYKVLQNKKAFAFADALVDSGDAKFDTAGSLQGGQLVFLSMIIPEGVSVPGDESSFKPYLLLTNGHDGLRPLKGSITIIRSVCSNTVNWAEEAATQTFQIKHTASIEGRVHTAREVLGITFEYLSSWQESAKGLVLSRVVENQVEEILRKVFPLRPDATDGQVEASQFAGALTTWKTSPNIANVRKTAWGVLNAVAEFIDYETEYKATKTESAPERRMNSILFGGTGQVKKQRAFEIIKEAVS